MDQNPAQAEAINKIVKDFVGKIGKATPAERPMALYAAAKALHGLVEAGSWTDFDHVTVHDTLVSKAIKAGMTETAARKSAIEGGEAGIAEPWYSLPTITTPEEGLAAVEQVEVSWDRHLATLKAPAAMRRVAMGVLTIAKAQRSIKPVVSVDLLVEAAHVEKQTASDGRRWLVTNGFMGLEKKHDRARHLADVYKLRMPRSVAPGSRLATTPLGVSQLGPSAEAVWRAMPGTPKELHERSGVALRTVKNLLAKLEEGGFAWASAAEDRWQGTTWTAGPGPKPYFASERPGPSAADAWAIGPSSLGQTLPAPRPNADYQMDVSKDVSMDISNGQPRRQEASEAANVGTGLLGSAAPPVDVDRDATVRHSSSEVLGTDDEAGVPLQEHIGGVGPLRRSAEGSEDATGRSQLRRTQAGRHLRVVA